MKFIIKKLLLACLITACFGNMLTAMDIGLYLAPKFIFNIGDSGIQKEGDKKNTQNMYAGGGISIGYNFDVLNKYSTLRIEFEYLYRNPAPNNAYLNNVQSMQVHTFLAAAYYDINFLYINYDNKDSVRSIMHKGKRPVMSVYLGFLLGGALNTCIIKTSYEYNGIFKNSTYYNNFQFIYGVGGGLAFHITPVVSIDLGYRLILNLENKFGHDAAVSVRFNF
ncbi:outer membrane protein [Brachyspira murdochii]|uniref:outer membrane protein n=1 Tax=Brachyspira murdochii TaxID=84378 RepID=UPI00300557D3